MEYKIGIMRTLVEGKSEEAFHKLVEGAAQRVEHTLSEDLEVAVEIFDFAGPSLSPASGAYAPLDFLRLGLSEKLERNIHFLLVITEVDLSAKAFSYVLALPSQLTNIGLISTKRLSPTFWGKEEDLELTRRRLVAIMLHTIGHLLNLSHRPEQNNVMYNFYSMEELARMQDLDEDQIATMRRNLPREAREEVTQHHKWRFALRQIAENISSIAIALVHANPFQLVLQLPTMITAALSVVIVLFFSQEIWDVASTLQLLPLTIFSLLALAFATGLLYRWVKVEPSRPRRPGLAESTVVTVFTTLLSLLLTMLLLYAIFFALGVFSAATLFPAQLKETWPTVDPAVRPIEHVKLGMFLAAMALLAGSLAGSVDSKQLVRHVIFLNEQS